MKAIHAPLLLFAYKRPTHLARTVDALKKNILAPNTALYIYIDGPRASAEKTDVDTVYQICEGISGFASVTVKRSTHNLGLAKSIISGVSEQMERYGKVIVLEDDLVTTPYFLSYMNEALLQYENDPHVFSIGGYSYPNSIFSLPENYKYDTYAAFRCCSWGWATWNDRWKKVDWDMSYYNDFMRDAEAQARFNQSGPDMTALLRMQHEGSIDSWAIRFCYAHFDNNMHCIYPARSLANNIGLDNSGTHCGADNSRENLSLDTGWQPKHFCPGAPVEERIATLFFKVFPSLEKWYKTTLVWKCLRKIKSRIWPKIKSPGVLFVNTTQKDGGAARAAWRLFEEVQKTITNARYLSLLREEHSAVDGFMKESSKAALVRQAMRLDGQILRLYPQRHPEIFTSARIANPFRPTLRQYKPSVVHLHWIAASMLKPEEFSSFNAPLVWTLHDTWAFTGGCHYTGACEGYMRECGHCPVLGSGNHHDLSYKNWQRKRKAYSRLNLTIVTPSRWLANVAAASSLLRDKRILVIPNGIDQTVYRPVNKAAAKAYFELEPDIPVVLFGSEHLNVPRKGGVLLAEALKRVKPRFSLLTFGIGAFPTTGSNMQTHRHVGALRDDISLALLYSAADVFVCPSREDNLPNTVVEALSCGTPCVAFDQGGLPDMIQHRHTGWLARPYEVQDLAEGIHYVITQPDMEPMRAASRAFAQEHFDLEKVSQKYLALYREIQGAG